jgi:hypothetical protein
MNQDLMTDNPTFEFFAYQRPDMVAVEAEFNTQLLQFETAEGFDAQYAALQALNAQREEFWTMYNLSYIRHSSNTNDAFYEAENDYFDTQLPAYEALNNRFFKALIATPFREALEQKFGKQLFTLADLALKTFKPGIEAALQKENALSSEYTKIKAQAKIEFEGTTYNLSNIQPIELSDDPKTRRAAMQARWQFYAAQAPVVEGIFDEMVHLRHQISQDLGYKNFVEVGYARMRRSDYTPDMVANYRKQIRELIVPLAGELYERQRVRLGLEKMTYYDEEYKFTSGNPKPIGTPDEIVANAAKMYHALSPQTDAFFQFMQETHLMDLVNRDGKAPMGYCTYLGKYQAPFIFSNFNGTSGDIDVLTHEAGHAFQVWSSGQQFEFDEYHWPTSDAAEIHSMSMEFFTWPWRELFFGPDTEKYHFMHLGNAIQFLPYGVAVDEFQHIVYENPDMTPAERNAAWSALEKIYLPHRNYDGNTFLENGGYWQKQGHIFNSPFYYIDYTLAQICAFQFWVRDRHNHADAWKDYVALCQAGGSKSFLDLVKLANLRSPFEDGSVESVVGEIRKFFASVDDTKF